MVPSFNCFAFLQPGWNNYIVGCKARSSSNNIALKLLSQLLVQIPRKHTYTHKQGVIVVSNLLTPNLH